MKIFARITAIVLIIIGILIIFGGIGLGITGAVRSLMDTAAAVRPLRGGGFIGLIGVGFIFIEGLTLTAVGQGLYLLADLSNKIKSV